MAYLKKWLRQSRKRAKFCQTGEHLLNVAGFSISRTQARGDAAAAARAEEDLDDLLDADATAVDGPSVGEDDRLSKWTSPPWLGATADQLGPTAAGESKASRTGQPRVRVGVRPEKEGESGVAIKRSYHGGTSQALQGLFKGP